ncbi:MAG TPA: TetR/AcrR family transcriptional regulator [Solirubrobacteraceae bacterium]|jgi:AcrR family transcriptional regulator|nr:TetR/AcrR family transcriptional regulator [Solirubrobacteraceae bacterium]
MPRPKQRTPELRDHVLAVALQLLAREGVGGFTTRELAREADTSTPAVYELFGDKAGLVREVFFAGFRLLHEQLDQLTETSDPRADLLALCDCYRAFVTANPTLAEVMFSRPFSDFEPSDDERQASASVRLFVLARVRRCIQARVLHGDETDIAHVLVALVQGLALAENARRLGRSRASVQRRWTLALASLLDGLAAPAQVVG